MHTTCFCHHRTKRIKYLKKSTITVLPNFSRKGGQLQYLRIHISIEAKRSANGAGYYSKMGIVNISNIAPLITFIAPETRTLVSGGQYEYTSSKAFKLVIDTSQELLNSPVFTNLKEETLENEAPVLIMKQIILRAVCYKFHDNDEKGVVYSPKLLIATQVYQVS